MVPIETRRQPFSEHRTGSRQQGVRTLGKCSSQSSRRPRPFDLATREFRLNKCCKSHRNETGGELVARVLHGPLVAPVGLAREATTPRSIGRPMAPPLEAVSMAPPRHQSIGQRDKARHEQTMASARPTTTHEKRAWGGHFAQNRWPPAAVTGRTRKRASERARERRFRWLPTSASL